MKEDPIEAPEEEKEFGARKLTEEEMEEKRAELEREMEKRDLTFRVDVLKLWPGFKFVDALALQSFLVEQGIKGASLEVETVEGCQRHGRLTKVVGKDIKLGEAKLSLPEEIVLDNDDTDPIRLSNVVRISPWSPEV